MNSGFPFLNAFLILFAGLTGFESTAEHYPSTNGGSIEGVVELSVNRRVNRSGAGLYGRRSHHSADKSVSADSVLIILMGSSAMLTEAKPVVYLNQKDRQFIPTLLPVTIGQTVRIQNSDPVYHNVFSLTSPHKFDVGRRPMGEYFDVSFEKSGAIDVFCDIHSNMHAVIYVLPSNTVAWTKAPDGGKFLFTDLPEGEYQISVYAKGYEEYNGLLKVLNGETSSTGTITLTS